MDIMAIMFKHGHVLDVKPINTALHSGGEGGPFRAAPICLLVYCEGGEGGEQGNIPLGVATISSMQCTLEMCSIQIPVAYHHVTEEQLGLGAHTKFYYNV
eukprot:scpid105682/ scgid8633/ 